MSDITVDYPLRNSQPKMSPRGVLTAAVLHLGGIKSPLDAVRVAIVAEWRG